MFIDDDAGRVAAIRDTAEVFVRRVERECQVRAVLFKASFALWAGAVGIDQAPDGDEVARFVFGNFRADLCYAAHDLMAGHNRVNSRHELAPFVAHRMQIGVADAAEENIDLHVALGRIASRDGRGSQWRCLTGSGVRFRVVCSWMHVFSPFFLLLDTRAEPSATLSYQNSIGLTTAHTENTEAT